MAFFWLLEFQWPGSPRRRSVLWYYGIYKASILLKIIVTHHCPLQMTYTFLDTWDVQYHPKKKFVVTFCCPLPTMHCPLPTAHYALPTA